MRISKFFALTAWLFLSLSVAALALEEATPSLDPSVRTDVVKDVKDVEGGSSDPKIKEPVVQTIKEPSAPTLRAPGKIIVGIVSPEPRVEFESKVLSFFKDQWSSCSSCDLRNLTVYDDKGVFSEKQTLTELEQNAQGAQLVLINMNWRYKAEEHKVTVDLFKKLAAKNILLLGSAGYPKEGESSAPLSRTVLTQIPEMVIIGEINERERLLGSSYFGPEMLTAIKPPRDYIGKGLGPSFFTAKLALNFTRKLPADWLSHFRTQKMKSRRIWPQVEEFFQR